MSRATFRAVGYRNEWLVNPRVHFTDTDRDGDDRAVDHNNNKKQPFSVLCSRDITFTGLVCQFNLFDLLTVQFFIVKPKESFEHEFNAFS